EPHKPCDGSAAGDGGKGLIGRLDQSSGKGDALGLIALKYRFIGPALKIPGQFPCKIDRITHACVHALSPHGAVNMGGIAEQESTPLSESVRDAVMNVIGGKPVHASNLERHPPHDKAVDVIPCQRLALCQRLIAHSADQPHSSIILEGKESQK